MRGALASESDVGGDDDEPAEEEGGRPAEEEGGRLGRRVLSCSTASRWLRTRVAPAVQDFDGRLSVPVLQSWCTIKKTGIMSSDRIS